MDFKVLLMVIAIFAVGEGSSKSQVSRGNILPRDEPSFRLPFNTLPLHYDLSLTTDIHRGDFDFSGVVRIKFVAFIDTSQITLHYRQLSINNIDLFDDSDPPELLESNLEFTLDPEYEFIRIVTSPGLNENQNYTVSLSYNGTLREDNYGFYRTFYKNELGETVWVASTHFQQIDARHAFPCYDEPQFRTTYSIDIRHDASYFALSNMPVESEVLEDETNYVTTRFEMTPLMQTYFVAFVVSDYASIENNATLRQRVFARAAAIERGEGNFALEVGEVILDAYEEYLGVPYNLPKLDQVAVSDFDWGGLWGGLCIYREDNLLFNETITTTRQRENILRLISHEYLHKWFGNLVSPLWWSYIWLNEGFAALYERLLTSAVYPEHRFMDLFVIYAIQGMLETDADPNIRPMTFYIERPEEILQIFDNVAYAKAGGVLQMLRVAIGPSTFTKGISNYLELMAELSAIPEDLYASIQFAVNEDYPVDPPNVGVIMNSWEFQSGFPLITVTREGNRLVFTQSRFYYGNETSDELWWVPINYVVASNPDFTESLPDLWMDQQPTVILNSANATKPWTQNDWIVVNIQETFYYRVNYEEDLWNLLINQLNGNDSNVIHLLNRAQLIDDSLNIARAGMISYEIPFAILEYLQREVDYVPWSAANRGLTLLNRWLEGTSAYPNYQSFVRRIVEPLFIEYGMEVIANEPELNRYARSLAINLACESGIESCLSGTSQRLVDLVENGVFIAPDLQKCEHQNIFPKGL
ncbi:CLUMA_CG019460, isoform A [Clunio marinus]|uniref:Aminopeptidase n=1 Tax=Clunio marinus TaxID=568069 RepID=A0A1J1J2K1_9DIPT|nr:CLUMA_CG019460, isoform A [Clunio marinus]